MTQRRSIRGVGLVDNTGLKGGTCLGEGRTSHSQPNRRQRNAHCETQFAEIVVWMVTTPLPGSTHACKDRLAFALNGDCVPGSALCVVRYDNEAGRGDRRRLNAAEKACQFFTSDKLFADFERDIRRPQDADTHA